jgi:hypothetical protein
VLAPFRWACSASKHHHDDLDRNAGSIAKWTWQRFSLREQEHVEAILQNVHVLGHIRPEDIKLPTMAAGIKETEPWRICDIEPKMFANADFCCDHFKLRDK